MTVPAIEPKLADVELVAIWDGLNWTIPDVGVPRRKEVPDTSDGERRSHATGDRDDEREFVPRRGKDLGQS